MTRLKQKKILLLKYIQKKYLPIEVEEEIDINEGNENNNEGPFILEVKDKIFKSNQTVEKKLKYNGKLFNEDRHKTSDYPKTVNYRCINYRKFEKSRKSPFCNALLKRKGDKKNIYYKLEKDHSKECIELLTNNLKIETNLIGTYNDYLTKCFKYLDSTEDYNKKDFKIALQNIYNENKYIFKLKENTIKNIIGRWKSNSLRFTKYNALENRTNKNNELRLWEYNNSSIYISNKKNLINSEYFIWTTDMIIARARITNHLFIDATFHHPYNFSQLLILIFKDVISSEYIPCFFILMSNKTEILYTMIFKSIINILTQQNIYKLNIRTITIDTEIALMNAINTNFPNCQRIGCWFHLKQDLLRESKTLGLLNKNNAKINPETTIEIIKQISMLPLEYNGDINFLKNKLNIIISQYPKYYNMIENYFIDTKMKYFIDGSYNYNSFPPDIRSNSILERYNKIIKTELGSKRNCNWVIFLNFINKELDRINEKLSKNENINVLYESKQTKFGINKFINNISDKNNDSNQNNLINQLNIDIKCDISKLWLKQNANNCRYNAFITLFYFTISPFLYDLKDNNLKNLNILNDLILKLSKDVNKKNYNEIIIFLQKNKYDTNNFKIDEILKEEDEEKKAKLIEEFKIDDTIDFFSSGYAAQLFSIFNNNTLFCFSETKKSECIICGKKNQKN